MNLMSSRTLLLLTFAALVLVLPAPIQAWQLDDLRLKHVPMPAGLRLDAAKK